MNKFISEKEFKDYICSATIDETIIASKFEVALSTVKRWKSGTACPLPRIRNMIINEIEKLMKDPT